MEKINKKSVAVFSNYFWTVYNFRGPLIQELIRKGYKVTAIASDDEYTERTRALGCDVLVMKNLDPKSSGLIKEIKLVWEIIKKLRQLDCEYIYTYTIKPNLFTSLTNSFTRKKTIVTINGRGNFLTGNGPAALLRFLFKLAFLRASKVIFQNRDDYQFFKDRKLIDDSKVVFVRGSGVNVQKFRYAERIDPAGDQMTFLMACRLLKEKGIFEYLEAATSIKKQYPGVKFWLLGVRAINPSAVDVKDIESYIANGTIESFSKTDDMNNLLEQVDVLVLPSYYSEGVPKILLEGLSKGLPIITTDWVGCKETVTNGLNGYLVPVKNITALAAAMEKMISLPTEDRVKMRRESRKLAENEFYEERVLEAYIKAIQE